MLNADLIDRHRRRRKLSYSRLGALVGVDPMTVWRWVHGVRRPGGVTHRVAPRLHNLQALSQVLGVRMEDLLHPPPDDLPPP